MENICEKIAYWSIFTVIILALLLSIIFVDVPDEKRLYDKYVKTKYKWHLIYHADPKAAWFYNEQKNKIGTILKALFSY